MKPTILPLAVMIAAGMCGCDIQDDDVVRPRSLCGDAIVNVRGCEYIKADVYGGYTYTHLGNCTNHAPVVVTNTVYVTNECTRQHWSYIVEPDPTVPLPRCEPLRWSTNGYWYVPVTNAVEK